ncbi:MAG: hypothetical protein ACP5NY_06460 [Thermocladium sp.]
MTYIGKIPPNNKKINEVIREKAWLIKYLLSGEALEDAKKMNRRPPTEPLDLIYGDPSLSLTSQRRQII